MIIKRQQKKQIINLVFYLLLVFILSLSLYNIELFRKQKIIHRQILGISENSAKLEEIKYWQNINKLYPSYYPALVKLLNLYEDNQDQVGINYCLEQIKIINPNSRMLKR